MLNEIKVGDTKSIDRMVIGIVETRAAGEQIVAELHRSGFGPNEISVIFPDNKESKGFALENSTKAPEGAVAGAGAGGVVGGTLGDVGNVLVSLSLALLHLGREVLVRVGLDVAEREVFELALERLHPEAIG